MQNKNSKKMVIGSIAFFSFIIFTAPLCIFGGMKTYADECNLNTTGKSHQEVSSSDSEKITKEYKNLEDYTEVAHPVTNGSISSDFNSVDSAHSQPHNGADIAATGKALAVVPGVVVSNNFDGARGNYIAVAFKHDGKDYTYLYQHLASKSQNSIGERIEKGEPIGEIGSTGQSSGVHLHAEVEYADMSTGFPRWIGTYPTNVNVMFDFITFFNLPRSFGNDAVGEEKPKINSKRCSSKGGLTTLEGNYDAEKVWLYLKKEGFSDEGIAGIIGNLMQESGCNPKSEQPNGPGRGIMQWTETERWAELKKWAAEEKSDEWELKTQLDFMIKEMKERDLYDKFKTFSETKIATDLFEMSMEVAGNPQMEARYQYAIDALAKFKK